MHYPWWYVPYLTAPMLIAVVSVLHVLVAHYAVGGGLFLAVETTYAFGTGNDAYLAYLKKHARFFVLLTVVFGAISGVGIWWTIGLASPLATAELIRTFVFGWAVEWIFFLLELVSAFIFYYYWGRLSRKAHLGVAWIYAFSAWASLVIITCITAFMLNPGARPDPESFWVALLNPQAIPQIVARTGGALLLSALYVYLHSAIVAGDSRLQELIEKRSTRPALWGAVLIGGGGAAWYVFMPPSAKAALVGSPVLNVLTAVTFAATILVFGLLYLGPYRNPGWISSPGFAVALLLLGMAAFSTSEFTREAVRKPYVIYNLVLGNQILAGEVDTFRKTGYLEGGTWTKAFVRRHYPQVISNDGRRIDPSRLSGLAREDRIVLGEVIFRHHCNDCHAASAGYSAVGPLIQGWSPKMIRSLVEELDQVRFVMPPWSGTPEEAELLTEYLTSLSPPRPPGMVPQSAAPEAN